MSGPHRLEDCEFSEMNNSKSFNGNQVVRYWNIPIWENTQETSLAHCGKNNL